MKNSRLERIRKVRSFNDIVSILKDIAKDVRNNTQEVEQLSTVLSSSSKSAATELKSIKINHRAEGVKPLKVNIKAKPDPSSVKVGGVRLTKFVAPSIDALMKHSDTVASLHENRVELDAVEATLRHSFSTSPNKRQALNSIKALRADIQLSLDKAFAALNKIATKHMPTEMTEFKDTLVDFLIDNLDAKEYSGLKQLVYATIDKSKNVTFSVYVQLDNLTTHSGYTFESFYVILTGVVDQGKIYYHLNTLPDFRPPGKYPIGAAVENATELLVRLKLLLSHNHIVSDLDKKPMPLDTQEARRKGFNKIANVADATVKNDTLTVTLAAGKSSDTIIENVVTNVLPLLNRAVGNTSRKNSVITYKKAKRAGKTVIDFILVPNIPQGEGVKKLTINLSVLGQIKSALDLDDSEVDAIKNALKEVQL